MTARRQILQGAAALGVASLAPAIHAQAKPVRIGYSMARTGPWTGGAQVSQEPNYLLWAEQVNAAGGLDVKGGCKAGNAKGCSALKNLAT